MAAATRTPEALSSTSCWPVNVLRIVAERHRRLRLRRFKPLHETALLGLRVGDGRCDSLFDRTRASGVGILVAGGRAEFKGRAAAPQKSQSITAGRVIAELTMSTSCPEATCPAGEWVMLISSNVFLCATAKGP